MKRPRKQNNRVTLIATFLLLIALPISVIGTQTVNDIRNRADEGQADLYFITDFSSDKIANAYIGIPYEHKIILGGEYTENSLLSLGCDTQLCGDKCPKTISIPPDGLILRSTTNTLIWKNPQNQETPRTWNTTISAVTPKEDGSYSCAVETFPLTLSSKEQNDPPQCKILFTRKKLDKIPQNFQTDFILVGKDLDDGIVNASFSVIKNNKEDEIQHWSFDNKNNVIINKDSSPSLSFILDETGPYSIKAEMTDTAGQTVECVEEERRDIFIVIPGDNGAPEFTSDPYEESTPGTSLLVGHQYSYTVEADDPNGDNIDYFIINETGWLNFTINKNKDGKFTGTFSGTPDQPGSYTVVIALNDGFHNHYSTQIWVINVDSPTNDTPVVKVVQPESGASASTNETVLIRWEATDNNLIESFDIFLATDPANESTLHPLATNIGYNYDSYIWNTNSTAPGRYYIVVRATDNQSPPATGQGISEIFTVTSSTTQIPPDDDDPNDDIPDDNDSNIPESYPQIKNLRPSDKSKIKDLKPLISADLSASNDNTIIKGSTEMKIDNKNVTESIEIRGEEKKEGTILYTPDEPMTEGSHKVTVSFRDSADQVARKTWTFTIETETTDDSTEPDDDVVSIFGFKIPKRIALIFGIGLLLLILTVSIPWLFYAIWKRSVDNDDTDFYVSPEYPPDTEDPDPPKPPMPIRRTSIVPTITEPESTKSDVGDGRFPIQESRDKVFSQKTQQPVSTTPVKSAGIKPVVDASSEKMYKAVSDDDVIQAFQSISSVTPKTNSDKQKKLEPKLKKEEAKKRPLKPNLSPDSLKQDSEQSPMDSPIATLPPTVPPIAP